MIQTNDDVRILKRGNVVLFNNSLWMVDSLQEIPHIKESQFGESFSYIVSLRK